MQIMKEKQKKKNIINHIFKHFRQFVQSDWFLPMFISHDKDTVSGTPD